MKPLDGIVLAGFALSAFQWRGVLPVDIRLVYLVVGVILVYTIYLGGVVVNLQLAAFLLVAGVASTFGVLAGRTTVPAVALQVLGIAGFGTALFAYFRLDLEGLERRVGWVLNLFFGFALYAVVQEVSYLFRIPVLYDINRLLPGVGVGPLTIEGPFMRVFSVFTEPGHFAIALTPAVYVAVDALLFGNRRYFGVAKSAVVLLALFFTFSSVGYFGLMASLIVLTWRRRALRSVAILLMAAMASVFLVAGVRGRLLTIAQLVTQGATLEFNVSGISFYLNSQVAWASLSAHPWFGSGLGSHAVSFAGYLSGSALSESIVRYLSFVPEDSLNQGDAYALLLRLPSELGLFGVLSVLGFLVMNRVRVANERFRSLGAMCLVYFATYCMREGHYFRYELWYFMALYSCLAAGAAQAGGDAEAGTVET